MSSTFQAEALEQFGDRENRANAHLVRLGTRHRRADIATQRVETLFLGDLGFHQHMLAEEPSDSWLALPAVMVMSGPSTGCSACSPGKLRIGAVAFVLGDGHLLLGDFAGFLVGGRSFIVVVTGTISASK